MTYRLDLLGTLKKSDSTPQGGLKAPAYLTRTGVFAYTNTDGSTSRELRHPKEVFSRASLATLRGAPLTVGHPGTVTSETWRSLAIGHVGDDVGADGPYVAAEVRVQDADTVARVTAGTLVDLSCGYDCDVTAKEGTYDGEPYDAVQSNIRYNHVGLGPSGWGRAGTDVGLRLDGAYTIVGMPTENIVEAPDVAPTPVAVVSPYLQEVDALKGRLDQATARIKQLEAETSPARIDARVNARIALHEDARKVLGADTSLAGKSDVEVMASVIAATDKSFRTDGKSEDYLRGRFEAAVASAASASEALSNVARATQDAAAPVIDRIEAARLANIERSANAWKAK